MKLQRNAVYFGMWYTTHFTALRFRCSLNNMASTEPINLMQFAQDTQTGPKHNEHS